METHHGAGILYRFATYRLDPAERVLLRDGRPVPLTPKAFETLVALVERDGRVVEKDDLLRRIWPNIAVEEATLAQNVFTLRKILGDGSDTVRYIETVPKVGYRFVAPVERLEVEPATRPIQAAATAAVRPRHRWLLAVVVVAGLAVVGSVLVLGSLRPDSADRVMLAVMPFENFSGDPSQEYLSDGLTEEMIAKFGALGTERLGVIARTTAMTYRHAQKTVSEIGRELGVNYVIEGSVRRVGDRLRITAQLIAVRDQRQVWSESYDRDARDLFVVESGVAAAIAREVGVSVTPETHDRLARARPVDPEAHDLYLRGRYLWNMRTYEHTVEAREYFQRAINRDPSDARSYAALAETYTGAEWAALQTLAVPLVARALALDDHLADAHIANAILKERAYDWPGAEQEFRRAIALDPNSPSARFFHAECLQAVGHNTEALAEAGRSITLDPFSVLTHQAYGTTLFYARQYDVSIVALRRALDLNPDYAWAHLRLARVHEQQGEFREAEAELTKVRTPDGPNVSPWVTQLNVLAGKRGEALASLKPVRPRNADAFIQVFSYVALDQTSDALHVLGQMVIDHDANVKYLRVDPSLDPLRPDARFTALLRQAGLQ